MKIHIEIRNLVLQGFINYHDHKQISYAIETELARLFREDNHLSQNLENKEIPYVSSVSEISVNKDPKRIGAEVAKSLFNELNKNF
jgi:hypothetical protein